MTGVTPLVDQEVSHKVCLVHIINIVIVITQSNQSLTYHIQQLGNMFQSLGLKPMNQELLSLETHLQSEPAQLLVSLSNRFETVDDALGQEI